MSIVESSTARSRAAAAFLLPFFSLARVAQAVAVWRNRRLVVRMRDFDDAQLYDIGLTRRDVEAALALPSDIDPTRHLIRARQTRLRGVRMR